jgi:hypothetical protein
MSKPALLFGVPLQLQVPWAVKQVFCGWDQFYGAVLCEAGLFFYVAMHTHLSTFDGSESSVFLVISMTLFTY